MVEEEHLSDQKNKKKAVIISLVAHILLLITFFLIAAWHEPDPPIPEYGIELAFIGQNNAVKTANNVQQTKPVEEIEVKEVENTIETQETQEGTSTVEESLPENENSEQAEVIEDIDSPDVNEDAPQDSNSSDIEEASEEIIEETSSSTSTESAVEESDSSIVPVTEPEPQLDERALFPSSEGAENESGGENESAGSSLNMSGWVWDFKPEPDDNSSENGKIVFKITVDDEGEIIGIVTIEKTVSPVVEKVYKNAVMDLTFSKTSDNKSVAPASTGTITFIIRSK